MKALLNGNPFAGSISQKWDYYFANLASLQRNPDTWNKYLILLLMGDEKKKKILLIGNHAEETTEDLIYLDYREEETRDILTRIYKFQESKILFHDNEYTVFFASDKHWTTVRPQYILGEISIDTGAGYRYGRYPGRLVDALLYSPYTRRYEIVRTSYLETCGLYCMDISIYKNFIEKFGNPGIIPVVINYKSNGKSSFNDLNVESVLHTFGYNVNESDGLSNQKRQSILSMVIDLELMEQHKIVAFIDWLISTHTSTKYLSARYKWSMDKEYVINYKANPDRFIIAAN